MASSTERGDAPMSEVEAMTEMMAKGAAMIEWQHLEIERLRAENASLRHQLLILREPA